MRRLLLLLLALALTPAPAPPSLRLFAVNDRGAADLLPKQRVLIVAELRSADLRAAALSVSTPAGLTIESYRASRGSLAAPSTFPPATPPFVVWTGVVSETQPINIQLVYAVPPATAAADLLVRATGQAGGAALAASTVIRVCCVVAPPARAPVWRVWLPIVR